jgi:hypothetical protein
VSASDSPEVRAVTNSSPEAENECLSCGEFDRLNRPLPEGECPTSKRPCGHHCNCSWVHDCCHWCGCEMGEEGEPQVGAVVAYVKGGEPHLAWREPAARQDNDHHWHVFHGMAFGWRTWMEVSSGENLRFLGIHATADDASDSSAASQGVEPQ